MNETLLFKNSSRQPTGVKPDRPVWETGQASFAQAVAMNSARGKNLTFTLIHLSIHSTDSSETLGVARGTSWATFGYKLGPKNLPNQ
jgi:hypothetical protein